MKRKLGRLHRRSGVRGLCFAVLIGSLTLVTACGGNSTGSAGEAASSPSTPKVDEKPVPISIVISNTYKYPDGMDDSNNPYINYIKQNTNLDIKAIVPPADGYNEKLNVIMASGDLPDMIKVGDPSWVVNYINQKALKPLNDSIDKYGADLKKLIPKEAWDSVTIDGKIYAIPSINKTQAMELMWVRKDWLDRLGLQVPKTLDDYVAVAKAFAEQDPDGNGKQDTLGLLIGENLNNTTPFFGAFGVQRRQWVDRGGQLVYSSTLPEMKQALQFLAGLYKDKIIDQEWALNKSQVVGQKIGSGKAGLYSGLWSARRGEILTNEQNDPNAKWVEAGFPIGKDGKSGTVAGNLIASYNVVPVTSKNADSVVKMLNFMIGKGYSDLLLGFENQIWTRDKDGKVVTNFEEHNKHVYRNSLTNIVTPSDRASYYVQLNSLGEQFNLEPNIEMINKVLMETKFTGIPTASMGKHSASLDKLENEYFTKIVLGISPIDTFDEFVAQWTKQGGAEMTKDVNDWYKAKK